eukprot:3837903-Rhodomonas_salina.1
MQQRPVQLQDCRWPETVQIHESSYPTFCTLFGVIFKSTVGDTEISQSAKIPTTDFCYPSDPSTNRSRNPTQARWPQVNVVGVHKGVHIKIQCLPVKYSI